MSLCAYRWPHFNFSRNTSKKVPLTRSKRTRCSDLRHTPGRHRAIGRPIWRSTLRSASALRAVFTTSSICEVSPHHQRTVGERVAPRPGYGLTPLLRRHQEGPPAAREYAVEPVGMATMMLSA